MISFVPGYYGFLGNQMFQYAATMSLAKRRGVQWHWPRDKSPDLWRLFRLEGYVGGVIYDRLYEEPHFHYDPAFEDLPDGTLLSGYFQSERYFDRDQHFVRYYFGDLQSPGVDAVSVHVRRGDYLSFPEHHPPLTVDYYRKAMAEFEGARFKVFSDDPGWCLLNLKPLAQEVDIITGHTAVEDMLAMAMCAEGHIIANSSFSWWGAWLDPNPEKKVIAPAKWFGPAKAGWDTKDLLPESWVRL